MYKNLGIMEKMEHIPISKTKEYFKETYSCYANGNYRAAVVSLWSVMVCDAVYKTEDMVNKYNDEWAIKRLAEISELQEKKSTSSDWELGLFESFFKDKDFIDTAGISNIRYLQQKRHLCAHPVLSENSKLYMPNKETVKSMLINALDDFLLKDQYYNKGVLTLILEAMRENVEYYEIKGNIKKLISRYSEKMTEKAMFQVFKSLWSISFKSESAECSSNRRSNHLACSYLFDEIKRKGDVLEKVLENIETFEKISNKYDSISFLFSFFCYHPDLYKNFQPHFKEMIVHYHNKDIDYTYTAPYNLKIASTFLFETPVDYFNYMIDGYKSQEINYLTVDFINFISEIYHDFDCKEYIRKMVVSYVLNALSYSDADKRFDLLFRDEILQKLDKPDLQEIVDSWGDKSQVRDRWRAASDLARINKLISDT